MAKQTRVKLNDTSKMINDIAKDLKGITSQLNAMSKIISNNINNNINRTIKNARVEVNNLFKDIHNGDTDLNKLKGYNPWGEVGNAILGNTTAGKALKFLGDAKQRQRQSIENAQLNYAEQMRVIGKKRGEVSDEYLGTVKGLKAKRASGQITDKEYTTLRNKAYAERAGKMTALSKQAQTASSEKATALALNSTTAFAKMAVTNIGLMVAAEVIKIGKKILDNAKQMIDTVASYSVSSSYKVNSSAREQMLTYGLSESQNYAFTQTKQLMGITSDEDLFWMNSNQKQMFSELMQKEMEMYDKMNSNGTLEGFQEMQIDLAVLKQEFYANVVKFIADNKDMILSVMEGTLTTLSAILQVTTMILNIRQKINPFYWGDKLFNSSGNKTITLNTYVTSNNANATDVANEATNSTLAQLSTYANS